MSTSEAPPRIARPLPAGMRDVSADELRARAVVTSAFLGRAALHGYAIVSPPVFEYASTIERGLGAMDPREIVRFVEPESGEVVALRPDVTPQIARLVATRMADRPPPFRLAYDASVVRRRVGSRARTHRQIAQVGVELIGLAEPTGDLELIVLAVESLARLGLSRFTVDLGHADLLRALVADLPEKQAHSIADALAAKDRHALAIACDGLARDRADLLARLPELHGPVAAIESLPLECAGARARDAIDRLIALTRAVEEAIDRRAITGVQVRVDLAEVRGLAYYTGPFFQFFAEGPGVAIGGGGRYDGLIERYGGVGRSLPASGLALDVDAVAWALRAAGLAAEPRPPSVVVSTAIDDPARDAICLALRNKGISAIVAVAEDAVALARSIGALGVVAAIELGGAIVVTRDDGPRSFADVGALIADLTA
jgi:ATP phosphoribosyltransferase regulatory subunit